MGTYLRTGLLARRIFFCREVPANSKRLVSKSRPFVKPFLTSFFKKMLPSCLSSAKAGCSEPSALPFLPRKSPVPLPQKPEKAPPAPFRSENPPLRICPPAGIRPPLPAAGCGSPRPFFRKKKRPSLPEAPQRSACRDTHAPFSLTHGGAPPPVSC